MTATAGCQWPLSAHSRTGILNALLLLCSWFPRLGGVGRWAGCYRQDGGCRTNWEGRRREMLGLPGEMDCKFVNFFPLFPTHKFRVRAYRDLILPGKKIDIMSGYA